MNSEEAKVLLHAYHFDAEDLDDPRMVEALEQTRRDPELLAWFNQQRALDAAVRDKLQQVRVPVGLAERIVAGRKARFHPGRHRSLVPLALAASLVFLISLGVVLWRPGLPTTEFAALQADMAGFLVQFPKLDLATDQWPEMQRWLNQKPALARAGIPVAVQKYPGLGCREVTWRGQRLMLVCFAAQGEIVHLFVVPKANLPDAPNTSAPAFARVKGWSTASWTQDQIAYLALTKGNQAFLRRLFPGPDRG
jgi:hypothetical protein